MGAKIHRQHKIQKRCRRGQSADPAGRVLLEHVPHARHGSSKNARASIFGTSVGCRGASLDTNIGSFSTVDSAPHAFHRRCLFIGAPRTVSFSSLSLQRFPKPSAAAATVERRRGAGGHCKPLAGSQTQRKGTRCPSHISEVAPPSAHAGNQEAKEGKSEANDLTEVVS
jgi:hypothetical protein